MRTLTMACGLLLMGACLPSVAGAQSAPEWASKKFTLEFLGGTVSGFVEAVREQCPELNVVVAEDVQDVRVQLLTLHNVTVVDALDTLDELLEPQLEIGPVTGRLESTTPVILIRGNPGRQRTAAFRTVDISNKEGDPTLVEAMEFAIDSLPNSDRRPSPKVRVHESTGIMIVTADEEQLRLIAQVVELLGGESRLTFPSAAGSRRFGSMMMGGDEYGNYDSMDSGAFPGSGSLKQNPFAPGKSNPNSAKP